MLLGASVLNIGFGWLTELDGMIRRNPSYQIRCPKFAAYQ